MQGVYIPSALLIVGTTIMKSDWVPYAIVMAAVLGGWKIYSNGEKCTHADHVCTSNAQQLPARCSSPTSSRTSSSRRRRFSPITRLCMPSLPSARPPC